MAHKLEDNHELDVDEVANLVCIEKKYTDRATQFDPLFKILEEVAKDLSNSSKQTDGQIDINSKLMVEQAISQEEDS